MEVMTGGDD